VPYLSASVVRLPHKEALYQVSFASTFYLLLLLLLLLLLFLSLESTQTSRRRAQLILKATSDVRCWVIGRRERVYNTLRQAWIQDEFLQDKDAMCPDQHRDRDSVIRGEKQICFGKNNQLKQ